ncbi:MAG: VCBS repeat-containing protein, partial [Deltaproteobacteria bacterium]|nr:VCBS repeat-containing protein [Deltaproteobacteria bacterium]
AWQQLDPHNAANTGFGDAVAVGDVDGDGFPDALAASGVVGAKALLHRGGASGGARTIAEISELPERALVRAVALADFDHDGRADLVVASRRTEPRGKVSAIDIHYSRADRFERRGVLETVGGPEIVALATGDLDGDGSRDLGSVSDDGALLLFAGDGHGFVAPDLELPAPAWRAGCRGSHLAFADLTGGGPEAIVVSFAGEPEMIGEVVRCPSGGGLAAFTVSVRKE